MYKKILKWLRNILIVWLLTGLWHGAAWNFIIWGLLYGILLVIEKLGFLKVLEKIPSFLSRIYLLLVVTIGFVIFSGNSVTEIFDNIIGLIGLNGAPLYSAESIYSLLNYALIFVLAFIFSTPIIKNIVLKVKEKLPKLVDILEPITLCVLLVVCISYLVDGSFNPFLYFRF